MSFREQNGSPGRFVDRRPGAVRDPGRRRSRRRLDKESTDNFWRELQLSAKVAREGGAIDFAGRCAYPLVVDVSAGRLIVRCRKCPACRSSKSFSWTSRAKREVLRAVDNAFVTLTFGPTSRQFLARKTKTADGNLDHALLGYWAYRQTKGYVTVLKEWLGHDIRYFFTVEKHKNGWPHIHGLIHSPEELWMRSLEKTWPFGFMASRRAKIEDSDYVCKYVANSQDYRARVRASKLYGIAPEQSEVQRIEEELRDHEEKIRNWQQCYERLQRFETE